jgi:drug/metabolite transporter (DMT)-like permease
MEHYQDGIAAHFGGDLTQAGAVLDYVPVASTFVRAITGLIGFFIIMVLSGKARRLAPALRDKKGMLFTFCAILCGPTIGVSLSLLATLYTNAGVAQTLMSLTPVLIIWPTWLIYRQKVTVLEVVGACVAVAGASLFFL